MKITRQSRTAIHPITTPAIQSLEDFSSHTAKKNRLSQLHVHCYIYNNVTLINTIII